MIKIKTEFVVSVIDGLRMFNVAWSNVSNTFHRARFTLLDVNTRQNDDETDNHIPLGHIFYIGLAKGTTTTHRYDNHLYTTASATENDIVDDIITSGTSTFNLICLI